MLRRFGLRGAAYPLDWVVAPPAAAAALIRRRFARFGADVVLADGLRPKVTFAEAQGRAFGPHAVVEGDDLVQLAYDAESLALFVHEDLVGGDVAAVEEKYARRAARFDALCRSEGRAAFLYWDADEGTRVAWHYDRVFGPGHVRRSDLDAERARGALGAAVREACPRLDFRIVLASELVEGPTALLWGLFPD